MGNSKKMDIDKSIIDEVYSPKSLVDIETTELSWMQSKKNTRNYSLARYALIEALRIINVVGDDYVLVPSFICRDILSSFNLTKTRFKFYDVDRHLKPTNLNFDKNTKAILVVNYFGFPQDMFMYKKICEENNCLLIEDNAHAMLSKYENNTNMGTVGDFSIFSPRKTIPIPDGGILIVNNKTFINKIGTQVSTRGRSFIKNQIMREYIKYITPSGIQFITKILRILRRLKTGSDVPLSGFLGEQRIDKHIEPLDFGFLINKININYETERRRTLFKKLTVKLNEIGIECVFNELPDLCSPMGLPFFADKQEINKVMKFLKNMNLECYKWPDLPEAIGRDEEHFYNKIWVIRFLW